MINKVNRLKRRKNGTDFSAIKIMLYCLVVGFIVLGGARDTSCSQELVQDASALLDKEMSLEDKSWDGPVLFHQQNGKSIHLILVEKSIQKLFLYRYDGQYHLLQSYNCSTGEKRGKKREEKDEKTPEGIYFNISAYRDSKITIFGDRAFGLNYPDVFDAIVGNTGSGIFIHGSNKKISPFATNGCIVLDTADLADLDARIDFRQTPIIIGERLPYRLAAPAIDMSAFVPFLQQALLPEQYHASGYEFRHVTVIKYRERVVAFGAIEIDPLNNRTGFSRLYLLQPTKNLLVMLKREWSEF